MVDLSLSFDPRGFSVGELHALFYPYKKHHLKPDFTEKDKQKFWEDIRRLGPKNVYQNIFKAFPQKDFIVDSSKDLFWIHQQNKNLKESNEIEVINLLTWKDPEGYANSIYKRQDNDNWYRQWVSYHRLYCTIVQSTHLIHLAEFTKDERLIESICKSYGLDYFKGKMRYWENRDGNYTLYGSTTAQLNMSRKNDRQFQKKLEIIKNRKDDSIPLENYQTIYKSSKLDDTLSKKIHDTINRNKEIGIVHDGLKSGLEDVSKLRYSSHYVLYRLLKRRIRTIRFKIKNRKMQDPE